MTTTQSLIRLVRRLMLGLSLAGTAAASPHGHSDAAPADTTRTDPETRVLETAALTGMDGLVAKLAEHRVVFVGESHDRFEHHLNQLAVIRGMYAQNPQLAIGLEFFQQPYQQYLDDYVAGRIDERAMLKGTEYFDRWRFDYRLYRPILRFARENGIALIALNVPRELTAKVADGGFAGLSEKERQGVPADVDRSDEAYVARIKQVFDSHPMAEKKNFDHFLEAQLLWDEGMAERAAAYLAAHPGKRMVVLAGSGHLMYGQGIPKRLLRRLPASSALILNVGETDMDRSLADFLLFPKPVALPKAGLIGVMLDTEGGQVSIKDFAEGSSAQQAGLKKGDRLLKLDGFDIGSYPDVRIAMLDKKPGDEVEVVILRDNLLLDDETLAFKVVLH